jgi:hypothetical protein
MSELLYPLKTEACGNNRRHNEDMLHIKVQANRERFCMAQLAGGTEVRKNRYRTNMICSRILAVRYG